MQRRPFFFIAGIVALGGALALAGCDSTESGTDGGVDGQVKLDGGGDGTNVQPDQGPPPEGLVTFKQAGQAAELTLEEGSEYLVVPYSVSTEASSGISYEIQIAAGGSISTQRFELPPPQRVAHLAESDPALWAAWQKRLAVEAWSRRQAEQAATAKLVPDPGELVPLAGEECTLSSDCGEGELCQDGSCTAAPTIRVGNFSAAGTITTSVAKKGERAAILVDEADSVEGAKIDEIWQTFTQLIYPRSAALFGDPPLQSGGATLSSDRNADGMLWLVLTSKVQEKEAVGFFDAKDFTEEEGSNKADILYIDAAAELDAVNGIVAHELQHLLSFAVKVYKPAAGGGGNGELEELWLDEGQSHFAEDACGFGGENVTLLRQNVFVDFSDTSMFAQDPAQDTLAMRGMAMTFVRYLFERQGGVSYAAGGGITDQGGAAWLRALHASSKTGAALISETHGDYKAAFDNWVAAISLDGRGVTSYAPYNFNSLLADPVTGNQVGLVIRGERKDNTGATIELQGPLEEEISAGTDGTIPNGSARFYMYTPPAGTTGAATINVVSEEADFRFAVIKLK